ncbi:MAG: RidA family protein [Bacteroidales bacterium]|nr:RidA family protein [Bacteroidales bacterium]
MKQAIILFLIILSACNTKSPEPKIVESLYEYDVEERIKELGIELSEPGKPVANYVNAVQSGNLVFMAGKGARRPDGTLVTGKVGIDLTIDQGYEAARLTAVEQLSALKAQIGDLNKVERIVKVFGMVNADPSFTNHSQVINGFSDLMVEIFGERGKHARAAVGMGSLPMDMACEIEMIVQVKE